MKEVDKMKNLAVLFKFFILNLVLYILLMQLKVLWFHGIRPIFIVVQLVWLSD